MLRSTRGAFPVIVIYFVAAAAATQLVPNWRLSHWFKKDPPTAQITADQKALADAQAQLAALKAQQDQLKAEAEAQKLAQLRNAQQNAAGVQSALGRIAPDKVIAEVKIAQDLNRRSLIALGSAIGALPADQQKVIEDIVTGALSEVEKERDDALAKLAVKDAELQVSTIQRQKAEAALPPLQAKADTLEKKVAVVQDDLTKKTQEVVTWADGKVKAEQETGSLGAFIHKLTWIIVISVVLLVAGYVLIHFILPSLAVEFAGSKPLQNIYRFITSITSAHPIAVPQKLPIVSAVLDASAQVNSQPVRPMS